MLIEEKLKEEGYKAEAIDQIIWNKLELEMYVKKCKIIKVPKGIKIEEIVYVLFRLTIRLRNINRYWKIPRKYMLKWKDGYNYFSGRKLEKNKLAKILKILDDYKFIKRKMKIKQVTKFRMGKNNPFYKQYFKPLLVSQYDK